MIYALRGYPCLKPYLKGFHATLDSWRPGRDLHGWKTKRKKGGEDADFVEEGEVFEGGAEEAKFKLKEDEGWHKGLGGGQRRQEGGKERAPERVRMADRLR